MSFFFFKQKTAYEMRISDWSSDVCSSDLAKGSGTTVQDVNKLLKMHQEMSTAMKKLKKMGGLKGLMGLMGKMPGGAGGLGGLPGGAGGLPGLPGAGGLHPGFDTF